MELINWWSVLIQSINLAIVVFVLHRFIFKPYLAYIDEVNKKREEFESNAAAAARIISEARHEADGIVASARSEAKQMASESESIAKKEAANIVAHANEEATLIKAKAESDIESERKHLEIEMQSRVLDIALKLNEKLFGKSEANALFLKQAMK